MRRPPLIRSRRRSQRAAFHPLEPAAVHRSIARRAPSECRFPGYVVRPTAKAHRRFQPWPATARARQNLSTAPDSDAAAQSIDRESRRVFLGCRLAAPGRARKPAVARRRSATQVRASSSRAPPCRLAALAEKADRPERIRQLHSVGPA